MIPKGSTTTTTATTTTTTTRVQEAQRARRGAALAPFPRVSRAIAIAAPQPTLFHGVTERPLPRPEPHAWCKVRDAAAPPLAMTKKSITQPLEPVPPAVLAERRALGLAKTDLASNARHDVLNLQRKRARNYVSGLVRQVLISVAALPPTQPRGRAPAESYPLRRVRARIRTLVSRRSISMPRSSGWSARLCTPAPSQSPSRPAELDPQAVPSPSQLVGLHFPGACNRSTRRRSRHRCDSGGNSPIGLGSWAPRERMPIPDGSCILRLRAEPLRPRNAR